jgi:protein-S-isoprenylcysteine O-methyltransferase Ste14
MSHRTADLPPLTGVAHVIRELRYHEVARQVLAIVLVIVYAVTAVPIPLLAAIGLPVGLLGALVRLYASGFIVKNQELATDGAYRFVRHPLYTGNILLVVGFALAGSRWWGIPTPALLPRFSSGPATAGDRRWSLAVSNTHGELVFVAFALACAVWIAWVAFA